MKLAILGPVVDTSGSTLTYFVKYFVAVIMTLWSPKEGGKNYPMRSKSHYAKGHINYMGLSS